MSLPHGPWFPSIFISLSHETKECTMSRTRQDVKKQAKAITRRRLGAKERHERQQKRAQRDIEGRLRAQKKLLGKIFGLMFPTLFGCVNASELTRARGWDKNWPSRILGALPKRSWLKRLRRLGLEVLVPLWRLVETKSPATQSRWQWTWEIDDSVFKKYGQQLNLVGRWWSGQHTRVLAGIDGLLLVVVVGDGK